MKSLTSIGLVGGLWLALILGCVDSSNRSRAIPSASTTDSFQLELLSYRGERSYNYLTVEGQVRNISGEKLENVMAVVECYGSDGTMITSEDGILEYNPVMPGQTSPFKVMIRDNPMIQNFKVNFKHIFGSTIAFKDSTPADTPKSNKRRRK